MADEPAHGFGSRSSRQSGMIDPGSLPQGPTRSKGARSAWVVFGHTVISLLLLVAIAAGAALYFGHNRLNARGPLAQETTVTIPKGSGTNEVAETLERAGVIESAMAFQAATRVTRTADALKAGEYQFRAGASLQEVIDTLVAGRGIQHALTIPEGWTSQMVADRLNAEPDLSGDPVSPPPEGTLLPDTYHFERTTTRTQVLDRMQAEQRRVLADVWGRRQAGLNIKNPADLVTMASVVERETGRPDERSRVASVFLNRLQKNMRLQSDPTVIYGMVGGKGRLDRALTRADLEAQTPYNTYTNPGLPAGPIANPGRASLEAVANPSQTQDLYFVADGTGGHAFAATLEDHNRNVARWRALQPGKPAGDAPTGTDNGTGVIPQGGAADAGQPNAGQQQASQPPVVQPDAASGGAAQTPSPGAAPEPGTSVNPAAPHSFADPVENTKLDPLLDKTYDLNSPQTVPQVGTLGDAAPARSATAAKPSGPKVPDLTLDNGPSKPADKPKRKPKPAKPPHKASAKPAQEAAPIAN